MVVTVIHAMQRPMVIQHDMRFTCFEIQKLCVAKSVLKQRTVRQNIAEGFKN